jgi:hypothetical protein
LLLNCLAVRADGQEAHESGDSGDIALRIAAFAVHTFRELGAAFATAARAAAALAVARKIGSLDFGKRRVALLGTHLRAI